MRNRIFALFAPFMLLIALVACGTNSGQSAQPAQAPLSPTTCSDKHQPALGAYLKQAKTGVTVYADLWDDGEKPGDKALFERKPDGKTWVIARDAAYGTNKSSTCTVQIKVVDGSNDIFEIVKLDGTKAGKDHDRKIASDELVVRPAKKLTFVFE